jgi:DNA modification methylase
MKQKSKMNDKPQAEINTVLYAVVPNPKLSTDAIALEGAVVSRGNGIGATSETYLMDCIVGMKHYPDKYFDLAVVDPPYGIGEDGKGKSRHRNYQVFTEFESKGWDNNIPGKDYFDELFRVSKHQIIWGGNYFVEYLQPKMGWIFWNKLIGGDFSDGELAYTSFDKALRMVTKSIERNRATNKFSAMKWKRIHPCQKPVYLYDWIFQNYAKPGNKILDTHLGSGSSRIAAHKAGLEFTAFETEEEYFFAQDARFKTYQSQLNLFNK